MSCGCGHDCGCHSHEHVEITKEEKIEKLRQYKESLKREVKDVDEEIGELEKN